MMQIKYFLNELKILRAKFMLRVWIIGFKSEKYFWIKVFPKLLKDMLRIIFKARRKFKDKMWNEFAVEYGYTKRDLEL